MQNRNWAMLFSVLLLLLHLVAASPPPDPPDALALLAFKSDADLGNELSFSQDKAFCEWHGVKCAGGRAVHVVIEGIPLGGVFRADSLTRLDQLRILSLQNDSLTGPIPDLSGLLNLRSLFLSHNSFAGYFPPSISFLLKLRTLDLSYNNLTGPLPASLTSIHRLYDIRLDRNRFNGSIPPLNQTSLRFFNVSGNDLSGAVPVTAALLRCPAASFASNPGLCGEIVRKECHPNQPFFESSPAEVAPPTEEARGISARLGDVHRQARAEDEKRVGTIIGFSTGVFVLVLSVVLFALAVRKQRGARSRRALTPAMSSDSSAAAEAAAVMRIEEADELGEKVKKVQQNHGGGGVIQVGRTGSLVFCAGEAQVYTLDQLMRASAELLGRGTVGTTYKAVLDNRLIVCVKRLDACKTACTGREAFERHMGSVGGLRHPNLVPLRAFFQAKEERLLVYDYQPNGSLHSLIHGSKSARAKPLHWTSCLKIAEDVAQGLSYIHQAWRLVHGNLKSSNVLLGADFEALLTDYSLALPTDNDNDPHSATSKSDVCVFGILVLELLTGKPPSEHPNLGPGGHLLDWVRSARRDGDGGGEEGKMGMVVEVAAACVVPVPERRPTMWQVLKMIQEIKEAVMEDRELLDPIISAGEAYS